MFNIKDSIADVCIYGDSPAAFSAAIQLARKRLQVVIVTPEAHVGGMLVEGLGASDIGNHDFDNSKAVGGIAREFYERIAQAYGYSDFGFYKFEPHVSSNVINGWLREAGVSVFTNWEIRTTSKQGAQIVSIESTEGRIIQADVFIDASIEGDLMAMAGVSYTWGRESNDTYGETLNGIRAESPYRNFTLPIDPYVKPGNPESGVIGTIIDEPHGVPGTGDRRIMGFCFRMCLTDDKENQLPFTAPEDYDSRKYEIYRRYFAAGGADSFFSPDINQLPGRKTDLGSWHDLSANLYGMNYGWPDGSWAERRRIYAEHKNFTQGLFYFLTHDPSVPEQVRRRWGPWGYAADEFTDNNGWPRRLYVRSARRMISDYVINESHLSTRPDRPVVCDPIGVAFWPPDSHHVRRIVRDGVAYNEGFVFPEKDQWQPFGISYQALVPKFDECTNLIVPGCPSSSYVGYGSLRLEWTFMVMGQGAGSAAAIACRKRIPVQDVPYAELKQDLEADKQVLEVH
ncbi:FAD-dependent oxidoreductase [Coraliomargarita sp. SDUM461004]|uniref:FAD-dependent oxidoreductase n=1 Tax=Thalassobacterium sedimentorum TaxID=3041258 RepID=A0ABU1AN11_9BACT|nr:FAD-dependent oxidoreductase [Coraliomargarita sp. SDUM461004]MDQ8196190.1 FAD-dependent oxidoreductase [Coraliomargarita sp. SDUM461004]